MKLFKVVLKGMRSTALGVANGCAYVVADGMDEAYQSVKKYLDEKDLGFFDERELDRVELIAAEGDYPSCKIRLYLQD